MKGTGMVSSVGMYVVLVTIARKTTLKQVDSAACYVSYKTTFMLVI
jgi:hypothetical protein